MGRPALSTMNAVTYWVLRLFDPGNGTTPMDANDTPTVTVRKNGASTLDSVTVMKRSATTGIYDCSYNPAGAAVNSAISGKQCYQR